MTSSRATMLLVTPRNVVPIWKDAKVPATRTMQDFYAARVRDAKPSPTLAVSEAARQLRAQGVDVIVVEALD